MGSKNDCTAKRMLIRPLDGMADRIGAHPQVEVVERRPKLIAKHHPGSSPPRVAVAASGASGVQPISAACRTMGN